MPEYRLMKKSLLKNQNIQIINCNMKYTRLLKNFLSRHVPQVMSNYQANNYWENLNFDKENDKTKKIQIFFKIIL